MVAQEQNLGAGCINCLKRGIKNQKIKISIVVCKVLSKKQKVVWKILARIFDQVILNSLNEWIVLRDSFILKYLPMFCVVIMMYFVEEGLLIKFFLSNQQQLYFQLL
eukprot:TRINITY_DN14591_c0_g2_i1.p2 TRINITY_DN14591_c0_g2~~TRINITY_DN14591_c0_g2_i1.p2  ORF type:complete len:115 (-),score=4.07 TRINITY_DN14591_c0_g2_i1:377-697(-)